MHFGIVAPRGLPREEFSSRNIFHHNTPNVPDGTVADFGVVGSAVTCCVPVFGHGDAPPGLLPGRGPDLAARSLARVRPGSLPGLGLRRTTLDTLARQVPQLHSARG